MDILFESDLVQNAGLASCAIFEAVRGFYEVRNEESGMPFPFVFLVLPLVFHKRTADGMKDRKGKGLLFKAIKDDPEIPVGLQARMEALSGRTWDALSLAIAANTLALDPDTAEVYPRVRALPKEALPDLPPVKDILKVSKRVGRAFAEHSEEEILKILKVVF